MKLDYDKMKLFGQTILNGIIVCVLVIVGQFCDAQTVGMVGAILNALLACYNSCILFWNKEYYKEQAQSSEGQDK